ncbi:MAG TPA: hypothetical protein VIL85_05895 [Thermomicrobiales bacterium]|jgi:hypothetical protein
MTATPDRRTTGSAERATEEQGSAGQSGRLSDDKLRDEQKTVDEKERAIEHGAEQYYRQDAPEAGTLEPGAEPQAPGKPQSGRSAT